MREIKFRQPIWEHGKFVQWHIWGFRDGMYQYAMNQHESYQFTGLKDKDGKEMYEGDICEMVILEQSKKSAPPEALQVVIEFKNACWGFRHTHPELVHEDDREWMPFYDSEDGELWDNKYFKVIGNTKNCGEVI